MESGHCQWDHESDISADALPFLADDSQAEFSDGSDTDDDSVDGREYQMDSCRFVEPCVNATPLQLPTGVESFAASSSAAAIGHPSPRDGWQLHDRIHQVDIDVAVPWWTCSEEAHRSVSSSPNFRCDGSHDSTRCEGLARCLGSVDPARDTLCGREGKGLCVCISKAPSAFTGDDTFHDCTRCDGLVPAHMARKLARDTLCDREGKGLPDLTSSTSGFCTTDAALSSMKGSELPMDIPRHVSQDLTMGQTYRGDVDPPVGQGPRDGHAFLMGTNPYFGIAVAALSSMKGSNTGSSGRSW